MDLTPVTLALGALFVTVSTLFVRILLADFVFTLQSISRSLRAIAEYLRLSYIDREEQKRTAYHKSTQGHQSTINHEQDRKGN